MLKTIFNRSFISLLVLFTAHIPFKLCIAADASTIANNVTNSLMFTPGLLSVCAYLIAITFTIWAIYQLKQYVDDPRNNKLRLPLIKFFVSSAFLALPTLYASSYSTIYGQGEAESVGAASISRAQLNISQNGGVDSSSDGQTIPSETNSNAAYNITAINSGQATIRSTTNGTTINITIRHTVEGLGEIVSIENKNGQWIITGTDGEIRQN